MSFFFNKKPLINSEEYEKINKKVVEIEAELERIQLAFALYKKQNSKKIKKILDDDEEEEKDPYNNVLGYQ